MCWFEFEDVHKAMVALDWKWFGYDDVPSTGDIKQSALRLMKQCVDEKLKRVETGGFIVETDGDDISLSFVISSWDTFD